MTALGEHMSTGRLTIDEYGERAAQVSTAKTRGELFALFTDLPQPHPTISSDETVTPSPLASPTASPLAVRSRSRAAWALVPLVPISWVAAFVVGLTTGYWPIFVLPVLLTVLGVALLARGAVRMGQRVVGNISEATGFSGLGNGWTGDEYRDAMRQAREYRNSARWERRTWQSEMMGQINEEIRKGMRGGYGRGGSYRRHHHRGRRRQNW